MHNTELFYIFCYSTIFICNSNYTMCNFMYLQTFKGRKHIGYDHHSLIKISTKIKMHFNQVSKFLSFKHLIYINRFI